MKKTISATHAKALRDKYTVGALPDGTWFGKVVRFRNRGRGYNRSDITFVVVGSGHNLGVDTVYVVRRGSDLHLLDRLTPVAVRKLWCKITTVSFAELETARRAVRDYERSLEDLSAFAKAVKVVQRRGYKLVMRTARERHK